MRHILIAFAFVVLMTMLAPSAAAGCWACSSQTGCCVEAASGTSGLGFCHAIRICSAGCACTNCTRSGSPCSGSGAAECTSLFGACEEHQTLLTVPNGEAIDPAMLLRPPAVEPALVIAPHGAQACKAV